MTTITFSISGGLVETQVPGDIEPNRMRQLAETITNNPLARHLAPILAGSVDVLEQSGVPEDDFSRLLASIVDTCDLNPDATVSVEGFELPEYGTSAGLPPEPVSEIVHACPPAGTGVMPCCGRTPFEARGHRMTLDPGLVTCRVVENSIREQTESIIANWARTPPSYLGQAEQLAILSTWSGITPQCAGASAARRRSRHDVPRYLFHRGRLHWPGPGTDLASCLGSGAGSSRTTNSPTVFCGWRSSSRSRSPVLFPWYTRW